MKINSEGNVEYSVILYIGGKKYEGQAVGYEDYIYFFGNPGFFTPGVRVYVEFAEICKMNQVKNKTNRDLLEIEYCHNGESKFIKIEETYSSNAFETEISRLKQRIDAGIENHLRKLEISRIMKERHKSGDFKDVSPYEFEKIIEELFTFMGYSVIRIGRTGDGGVDLTGKNNKTGEKIIIQCKKYGKEKVGAAAIREFYGAIIHNKANKGFLVTTSDFTNAAIEWVKNKQIELINGSMLSKLMMTYYK